MTLDNNAFSYLIISFVKYLERRFKIVKAINIGCQKVFDTLPMIKWRLQHFKSLFKINHHCYWSTKITHSATRSTKKAHKKLPNQGQVNKKSTEMTCIRHRFLPPSEPGDRLSMQRITANNMSVARSVRGVLGLAHLSRRDIRSLTLAPFTRDIR